MHTKPIPCEPPAAAYEAAVAEERQLWQIISDQRAPATERVTAYARWLEAIRRLEALAATVDGQRAAGGPT